MTDKKDLVGLLRRRALDYRAMAGRVIHGDHGSYGLAAEAREREADKIEVASALSQ